MGSSRVAKRKRDGQRLPGIRRRRAAALCSPTTRRGDHLPKFDVVVLSSRPRRGTSLLVFRTHHGAAALAPPFAVRTRAARRPPCARGARVDRPAGAEGGRRGRAAAYNLGRVASGGRRGWRASRHALRRERHRRRRADARLAPWASRACNRGRRLKSRRGRDAAPFALAFERHQGHPRGRILFRAARKRRRRSRRGRGRRRGAPPPHAAIRARARTPRHARLRNPSLSARTRTARRFGVEARSSARWRKKRSSIRGSLLSPSAARHRLLELIPIIIPASSGNRCDAFFARAERSRSLSSCDLSRRCPQADHVCDPSLSTLGSSRCGKARYLYAASWGRTGLCCRRTTPAHVIGGAPAPRRRAMLPLAPPPIRIRLTIAQPHTVPRRISPVHTTIAAGAALAAPPHVEGLLPHPVADFHARGLTAERRCCARRTTSSSKGAAHPVVQGLPGARAHRRAHVDPGARRLRPPPQAVQSVPAERRAVFAALRDRPRRRQGHEKVRRRRRRPAATTPARRCRARGARYSRCRRRCR